jgi:hypothetical protein
MQAVWNCETPPSVTVLVQLLSLQMVFFFLRLAVFFVLLKIIAPCFAAGKSFQQLDGSKSIGIGAAGRSAHTPVWPVQARPAWEQATSRTRSCHVVWPLPIHSRSTVMRSSYRSSIGYALFYTSESLRTLCLLNGEARHSSALLRKFFKCACFVFYFE